MTRRIVTLAALGALFAGSLVAVPVTATSPQHANLTTQHVTLMQQAFSGVTGSATLTYNASTKMTTVKVTVSHLEPNSSHPEHIHAGKCTSNGPVLEALTTLKANAQGSATATTQFKGSVMNKAAYINVHLGPGLALTEYTVLACGGLGKGM